MYLIEIIVLTKFIVTKGAKINITTKKDRNKTATITKKNNYSIIIKKKNNNNNNKKTRITILANSKPINLTKL